jgi:2-phospho-L-lactate guanylyltransferase (CobY/MobA/RfbA family)
MFGAHSARRHLAQTAGAHGAPTNDYPSLRRDIDMPSDLVGLAAAQGASGRFVRAHFGDLVPCL